MAWRSGNPEVSVIIGRGCGFRQGERRHVLTFTWGTSARAKDEKRVLRLAALAQDDRRNPKARTEARARSGSFDSLLAQDDSAVGGASEARARPKARSGSFDFVARATPLRMTT
jgi:hypothetical protein